jgi:hypothetical protein
VSLNFILDILCSFEKTYETLQIHPNDKEYDGFIADTSDFLRKMDCPYQTLYNGSYEERFNDKSKKITLINYFCSEVKCSKINGVNNIGGENGILDCAGKGKGIFLAFLN